MEVVPVTSGELGEVELAVEVSPYQQPDRPENEDDEEGFETAERSGEAEDESCQEAYLSGRHVNSPWVP
jgi:hypothetical protein